MAFVVSEWAKTTKKNAEAIYHSVNYPGHSYRFQMVDSKRNRYACANCRTSDVMTRVEIRDSVFTRNPYDLDHVCRVKTCSTSVIVKNRKVLNDHKAVADLSPAIPSKIYRSVTDKCVMQYETAGDQHQARLALPQLAQISRKWLRTLLGGVFLTNDHQSVMWDHLLQNPPLIPERANLTRFVTYFRHQWHTDAARALINQHENRGPRTTNFSEGWNNTLRNKFGSMHPGLGEFIQTMKRELYSQSILSERLLLGEPIRLRRAKYREAEQRLAELRLSYAAVTALLGDGEIGPDAVKEILIPLARRMAYYCATFVNRETRLETSNIRDPEEEDLGDEENGAVENNGKIDENLIENDDDNTNKSEGNTVQEKSTLHALQQKDGTASTQCEGIDDFAPWITSGIEFDQNALDTEMTQSGMTPF